MIIALEGHHRSGKTTLAKELEALGWIRCKELISDDKGKILKSYEQMNDCTVFTEMLEIHLQMYEQYKDELVVFDRSIWDIYMVAFIMLKPQAFEEFLVVFKTIKNKINYDALVWLEEIHPPKNGIEHTLNTLLRWKVKPICDIILPPVSLEKRLKLLFGGLYAKGF